MHVMNQSLKEIYEMETILPCQLLGMFRGHDQNGNVRLTAGQQGRTLGGILGRKKGGQGKPWWGSQHIIFCCCDGCSYSRVLFLKSRIAGTQLVSQG